MSNVLPPGTPAPDFTLPVTPDQKLSLKELRGQPVILAFYPADWSPVCGDQMALYNVVIGHFIFVYIHPYMDGNGRIGRFLMNLMMAAGGYPWTVVPLSERQAYMTALEKASVGEDIAPFADFLAKLVEKRLAGEPLPEVPKSPRAITHE
jgi:hypothetical protein